MTNTNKDYVYYTAQDNNYYTSIGQPDESSSNDDSFSEDGTINVTVKKRGSEDPGVENNRTVPII